MTFELHDSLDEGALTKLTRWGHHDLELLSSEDMTLINLSYRLVCGQLRVFLHYGHKPSKLAVDYGKIFASEGLILLQVRINSGDVAPNDGRLACYKKILEMLQEYQESTGQVDPTKGRRPFKPSSVKAKRYEYCFVR